MTPTPILLSGKNKNAPAKTEAFTLIELLIAMAVATMVLSAVTAFFTSQTRVQVTQTTVVDMQQEARAAMSLMTREIRMAGYDPTGGAGAGITTANYDEIAFSADLDGDGTITGDENLHYEINTSDNLGREAGSSGTLTTVVENVDGLGFNYLNATGAVINAGGGNVPAANLSDIRSVQMTLVARSGQDLPGFFIKYTDNQQYMDQQGNVVLAPPGDEFRRIQLFATAQCRNLGLSQD